MSDLPPPEPALPALPLAEAGVALADIRRDLAPSLRIMLDERLYTQVKTLAGIMSRDHVFTPRHLRDKPEACFTVITQAVNWNIDPSFVARCTYQTPGGAIGFEGKLVQAILEQSNRFIGGPKVVYVGDWSRVIGKFTKATSKNGNEYVKVAWTEKDAAGLGIIISWHVKGEVEPRVWPGENEPFYLTQCYPLSSPLWATDAKQQIRYLAMRRFADGAAPGILGGMAFDFDELMSASERMKDVTPEPPPRPRREDFVAPTATTTDVEETQEPDPIEVVDCFGNVTTWDAVDEAVAAYRIALDEAEEQRGDEGLKTVIDNNGLLFTQLEERGHADLSRELSLEGGKRREAARAKETAVPRGTDTVAGAAASEPQEPASQHDVAERAAPAPSPGQPAARPSSDQPGLALQPETIDEDWLLRAAKLAPGNPPNWKGYANAIIDMCSKTNQATRGALLTAQIAPMQQMRREAGDHYKRAMDAALAGRPPTS